MAACYEGRLLQLVEATRSRRISPLLTSFATVASGCGVAFADIATSLPEDPRCSPCDAIHFSDDGNRELAMRIAAALKRPDVWSVPEGRARCH